MLTFLPYFLIFWFLAIQTALVLVVVLLLVRLMRRPGAGGTIGGVLLTVVLLVEAVAWALAAIPEPSAEFVFAYVQAGAYALAWAVAAVWVLAVAAGRSGYAKASRPDGQPGRACPATGPPSSTGRVQRGPGGGLGVGVIGESAVPVAP